MIKSLIVWVLSTLPVLCQNTEIYNLLWEPSQENVSGYVIYFGQNTNNFTYSTNSIQPRQSLDLEVGKRYFFTVSSFFENGWYGPFSETISYKTVPKNLKIRINKQNLQAELSFSVIKDLEYDLQYAENFKNWKSVTNFISSYSGDFIKLQQINNFRFYRVSVK